MITSYSIRLLRDPNIFTNQQKFIFSISTDDTHDIEKILRRSRYTVSTKLVPIRIAFNLPVNKVFIYRYRRKFRLGVRNTLISQNVAAMSGMYNNTSMTKMIFVKVAT